MNDQPPYSGDALAMLAALRAMQTPQPNAARLQEEADPGYDQTQLDEALTVQGRALSQLRRLRASLEFDRIEECPECDAPLGLPAPEVGLPTETWRCAKCHSVIVSGATGGSFDALGRAEKASGNPVVALARLAASQPAALQALVRDIINTDYIDEERRAYPRYTASVSAVAIPLDDLRRVARPPIRITTRDISVRGLAGFSESPLPTSIILLDFTMSGYVGWQVALKVKRRRTAGFLHEFAGDFLTE